MSTHSTFIPIKIHTAKCDTCNKHNTQTMFRCADCGQQCCTPCWLKKGGDGTHILNAGDKGWTGQRAQVVALPRKERQQRPRKATENRVVKKLATRRKSRYVVVDEEDEDEIEEEEKEEEEEEEEEEPEEGEIEEEVAHNPTRRVTQLQRTPTIANNAASPTTRETPEDYANLPVLKPTPTQPSPSIRAAADRLLRNAIDPSSRDDKGMHLLLRATAEVEKSPSHPRTAPESGSSVADLEQDAQRQTPLFVKEELVDLELEAAPGSVREEDSRRESRKDKKGKGQCVQDGNAHEDDGVERAERSTVWE